MNPYQSRNGQAGILGWALRGHMGLGPIICGGCGVAAKKGNDGWTRRTSAASTSTKRRAMRMKKEVAGTTRKRPVRMSGTFGDNALKGQRTG